MRPFDQICKAALAQDSSLLPEGAFNSSSNDSELDNFILRASRNFPDMHSGLHLKPTSYLASEGEKNREAVNWLIHQSCNDSIRNLLIQNAVYGAAIGGHKASVMELIKTNTNDTGKRVHWVAGRVHRAAGGAARRGDENFAMEMIKGIVINGRTHKAKPLCVIKEAVYGGHFSFAAKLVKKYVDYDFAGLNIFVVVVGGARGGGHLNSLEKQVYFLSHFSEEDRNKLVNVMNTSWKSKIFKNPCKLLQQAKQMHEMRKEMQKTHKEWRPWAHSTYPTAWRAATRTLALLAKARQRPITSSASEQTNMGAKTSCKISLHEAAAQGDLNIVKALANSNNINDAKYPRFIGTGETPSELNKYSMQNHTPRHLTPLHLAILNKHRAIVKFLLSISGIDATIPYETGSEKRTALDDAIVLKLFKVATLLVSDDASRNQLVKATKARDKSRELNSAVIYTDHEKIRELFEFDQLHPNGVIAIKGLYCAAEYGVIESAKTLMKFGVNPQQARQEDLHDNRAMRQELRTPLDYAAEGGHYELFQLFLDSGAVADTMTLKYLIIHNKRFVREKFDCLENSFRRISDPELQAVLGSLKKEAHMTPVNLLSLSIKNYNLFTICTRFKELGEDTLVDDTLSGRISDVVTLKRAYELIKQKHLEEYRAVRKNVLAQVDLSEMDLGSIPCISLVDKTFTEELKLLLEYGLPVELSCEFSVGQNLTLLEVAIWHIMGAPPRSRDYQIMLKNAGLLIEYGASISNCLNVDNGGHSCPTTNSEALFQALSQHVDFTKMSDKDLMNLSNELLTISRRHPEFVEIMRPIRAAIQTLRIGEWRPQKHADYPRMFRKAMTTLVKLAKTKEQGVNQTDLRECRS